MRVSHPRTAGDRVLNVSIVMRRVFKAVGIALYSGPTLRETGRPTNPARPLDASGPFEQILTEFVGYNATHGALVGAPGPRCPNPLRVGVRDADRRAVDVSRRARPLVLGAAR